MTFTYLWLGWIAAFLIIEASAIWLRPPGDTLSEKVWAWFRVRDKRPTALVWLLRVPLYAFLIWLAGHLAFGWWTA
jgi:hypothetical protein